MKFTDEMRPGIKTIIVGGVVFILGAVVVPFLCILPIVLENQHDAQFKAPGSMDVDIKEAGRYYLWNDFRTIYNGRSYDRSEQIPGGLEIQILDANGHLLPFVSDGSFSSTNGSSAKRSVGYVEIDHPGKVRVQVSGKNEEWIISFAQSGLLKSFGLIVGGVSSSMLFAPAGLGLIARGIVKLVRANRASRPNAGVGVVSSMM